jgi:hypothetical protein
MLFVIKGFFGFEDNGIYLVTKTNYLIMPKSELPIEKGIH